MPEGYLHGVRTTELSGGARAVQSVDTSTIFIVGTAPNADAAIFPVGKSVLIAGSRTLAASLDTVGTKEGTLPRAMDGIFAQAGAKIIVHRVAEGADQAETITNVIGAAAADGSYSGLEAARVARSATGLKPRILVAPGFSSEASAASKLAQLADQTRSFAYIEAPGTTDQEAFDFRDGLGTKRALVHAPNYLVRDENGDLVSTGASAFLAGLRAKVDANEGYHYSISNHTLQGIEELAREIGFEHGDENSQANILNSNHIATTVRDDGWRVWGARGAQNSDTVWLYEAVTRTADVIADSITTALRPFIDKPATPGRVDAILSTINGYLRYLQSKEVILGGHAWVDPELYTAQNITLGKLPFDYGFTPTYPIEQPEVRYRIVDDYLTELVA